MLELTRSVARALGWPDEAVHFEYFKNTHPIDQSSSFTVELARSALTLEVPAGKSILEVMRDNGLEAPSSCEQGACGTCMTRVLEGVPDHQDVYLNDTERAANTVMMTCVSRAKIGATGARYLMRTLYDFELSAECYRVRLLLGFLGLKYDVVPVDIFPGADHNAPLVPRHQPAGHPAGARRCRGEPRLFPQDSGLSGAPI